MVTQQNYKGILSTIGNTPEVELENLTANPDVKIIAKLEGQNPTGSVKDRIALRMIEQAERSGDLNNSKIILEPTSGNTGISLAMIGRLKGYKVTVVMPENVSAERTQLLEAYGASIIYSDGELGTNGSIDKAQEVYQNNPNKYTMMYQYGNDANPDAHYHGTALEIIHNQPDIDMFVAGLGTGGTLMGNARRLKEHNDNIKIVAVAPEPDDLISGLRRLEDGFIPPILDISLLDARLMVGSYDAFHTTKRLLNQEGIFAGVSSG
ncbi:MAG: cysteine synthase B, partial [Dehalococcoidia bacterium]|nr:cysteine synthase B [Dehalococcoidia bacterium]